MTVNYQYMGRYKSPEMRPTVASIIHPFASGVKEQHLRNEPPATMRVSMGQVVVGGPVFERAPCKFLISAAIVESGRPLGAGHNRKVCLMQSAEGGRN